MSDGSKIEWTDASWNPIRARNKATGKVGHHCVHHSPGCVFCYAEVFNKRLGTGLGYRAQDTQHVEIYVDDKALALPLRWKKPRKIFVCSMSDLFGEFVADELIDRVFAVMALSFQHTFQVLTKRADRMRAYLMDPKTPDRINAFMNVLAPAHWHNRELYDYCAGLPLRNVWLGVSTEDQKTLEQRTLELLQTPAAVRFISVEPLLEEITLFSLNGPIDVPDGIPSPLHWVIVGGESGRHARPVHPDWVREIRDQCAAAGVAFFFKQWGEWAPFWYRDDGEPRKSHAFGDGVRVHRIGKASAGALLDGVEHRKFPA